MPHIRIRNAWQGTLDHISVDLPKNSLTVVTGVGRLEREGLIYTVAGVGCFVARQSGALLREQALVQAEEHLRAAAKLAAGAGLGRGELHEMLDILLEEPL